MKHSSPNVHVFVWCPYRDRRQIFLHRTITPGSHCTCVWMCVSALFYVDEGFFHPNFHSILLPLVPVTDDVLLWCPHTRVHISPRACVCKAWINVFALPLCAIRRFCSREKIYSAALKLNQIHRMSGRTFRIHFTYLNAEINVTMPDFLGTHTHARFGAD